MSMSKTSHKGLIIGIALAIVVVAILFIPMIPIQETYNETEPYNRLATYQVTTNTLTQEYELLGRGVYHRSTITVKNTDSYGGTFTVMHYLYDVNGLFGSKTTTGYIAAGGTQTFIAEFDTSTGQDVRGEYLVTAPTVIDQKIIVKERTVYESIIGMLINR